MGKFVINQKLQDLRQKYFVTRKIAVTSQAKKTYAAYLTALCVVFSFAYVWQINHTATLGYEMKDLEYKISQLQKSNKDLRIAITEAQVTDKVLDRLQDAGMVPVGRVSYISATSTDVALNR